ncbi:MAG: glycyl-radical enzyme activating protein [Clostridia bacterium]|nr:glycyl-radical enzyme activating protein [Clostridia bacterium]
MAPKGYVMQLQPFSVNDGDGIRTTVFLAGCSLHCAWCANPEGCTQQFKTGWYIRKCIGCGECAKVCPQGIGIDLNAEREKCIACGKCTEVCPQKARVAMVQLVDADDVLRQIQTHRLFYAYSGGGITFSGGEACLQPEFLNYLTEKIYDMGYSMAIETCGQYDLEPVRPSLSRMGMIFMDLKHMDSAAHKRWTGAGNERILENMKKLADFSAEVVIRIPCIIGVNADEDNIRRSARFVKEHLPEAKMELLPYHSFGKIKYEALGIPYDHPEFGRPTKEELEHLREIVRSEGVETADFR